MTPVLVEMRRRLSAAGDRHPYSAVASMIAMVTAVGLAVANILNAANVDALYLLVVLVAALRWGRRPALFAASVSTVVFDFCFIPPRFSFAITDLAYLVMLSVFVLVAMVTSALAARAHDLIREQSARAQAEAVAQAKDALLNRVAHELRSPLTTILGWVQILRQNAADAQRTARGLAGLERNAQLLARLVGDLLDASRIHLGKLQVRPAPIELAPVVSRALEDAAIASAEKGVQLECGIAPVGMAIADEQRIEQIVRNLVANAIKFTPPGGRVAVSLSGDGATATLCVTDTGQGIPVEFLPHVFEPFSQARTAQSQQGLGLGLAIVKHLAEAHRGRISVDSRGPGHGCTFVVELPLMSDAAPQASGNVTRSITLPTGRVETLH